MTSNQEIMDVLHDRQSTYAFLSQMYREEISIDLLQNLVAELVCADYEIAPENQGYALLASFARGIQNDDFTRVKAELAVEYARLFLGVKRRNLVPCESVYTSERRLMMQDARDQVVHEYHKEGLDPAVEFTEPEDHVAIELAFMSHLCQKAADAVEREDSRQAAYYVEQQRRFLTDHLEVWVPRLCDDILGLAESDFYKGIIMLTQEHLNMEQDAIEELALVIAA
jgi:anaerobic sulfite reductase subunit A